MIIANLKLSVTMAYLHAKKITPEVMTNSLIVYDIHFLSILSGVITFLFLITTIITRLKKIILRRHKILAFCTLISASIHLMFNIFVK